MVGQKPPPVADSASASNRTQVSSTTTSSSNYKLQLAHPVRVKTMQDLFIVNGIPQIRTVTILIGAGVKEDDEQIEIEKTYNGKTHLLEQTTHETNENTILQAFVGKKILILERTNTVKQAEMVRNVFSMSSKMVYDEIRGTLIDGVMNDNDQMRIIFHTKTKKTEHYLLKEETFCFTFNGSDKGLSIIDSSERIDPTGKNKDERTLRNVGGSNIYTNNIDFEEKVVVGADYIEVIRSATLPFQDRDGDSLWDNMVTRCTSKRKYTSDNYEVDGSLAVTEATLENTDFGDEYSQESFYDTPDTRRGTRRSSSRDRCRRRSRDSHNDTGDETLRYRGPNPTPNGGQVDSHARHRSHSRNRTIQNADLHARHRSHSRNRDNRNQNADPQARPRSHSRNRDNRSQNADLHARPRSHSRNRDNMSQNADPHARPRSHSRSRDNRNQNADLHARPRSHSRNRDDRNQNSAPQARRRSHSRNRDNMTQNAGPQVRPRSPSRSDNRRQNADPHARPRSHSRNRTSQNADPLARHRSHSRNRDNRSQNTTVYRAPVVEEMDTSEERQARRNAAPRRPRSRSRSRQSRSRSRSRSRGRNQSGTRAVRPRGPLRRPGQTEPDPSSSSSSPEQEFYHSPQQRGRSGRMRTGGKNPALLPPPPPADSSSSGSSYHPSSSASSGSAATQPSAHNSAAVSAHFDSSGTHTPRSRGRSPFAPKNSDKSTQYEPPSSASGGRSAPASRQRSSRSRSRETRTSGTQYEAPVLEPEVNVTREDARRLLALTPLHPPRSPATRSKSKSPQTARRMADQFRGATTIKTKKRLGEPLWKKSPSKSKAKSPAKSPAKSKTKSPSKSLAKTPAKSSTQGSPTRLMRQVVTTDNLRTGSSTTQETLLTYNRGTNQPPPPTNPSVPSPNEARRLVTNVAVNLPDEANLPSSSTNPPTRTTTTHPIRLLTRINDESFEMVANFQLIHTGLPPNFRPQTIWVDGKKYWSSQEEPPVYDEEDKS